MPILAPTGKVAFGKRFVSGSKIVERVPSYRFWPDKAEDAGIISGKKEQ
jgi:hypothetical protein